MSTSQETTQSTRDLPYVEASTFEEEAGFEDLPGRPLRGRLGPLTIILCGCALIAGAFYAGVRVEKSKITTSSGSGSALAAAAARFGAAGRTGTGTGTGAAGTGAAGGAVAGTIRLVDGNNV